MENFFDYIALGHIHSPQKLGEKIVYPGSIERVSFAEEGEEKKFVYAEIGGSNPRIEFIPLNCRPMKTIRVDWRGLNISGIISQIKGLKVKRGTLLKIIASLDTNSWRILDQALSMIQSELEDMGVVGFKIVKEHVEASLKLDIKKDWKMNLINYVRDYIERLGETPEVKSRAIKYAQSIIEEVKER